MRSKNDVWAIVLAMLMGIGIAPTLSLAATPTEAMRKTSDEVIRILEDPVWKKPDKKQERRKMLVDVIGQRFNYLEMARRTLGSEWGKHSPEEQRAFAADFQTLLAETYLDGLDGYSGERVQYLKELNDGQYGEVVTKIDNGTSAIDLTYKVMGSEADWQVYDVEVEGVSLVQNYRQQFMRIIRRESFAELSKQLRTKADRIKAPASIRNDVPQGN